MEGWGSDLGERRAFGSATRARVGATYTWGPNRPELSAYRGKGLCLGLGPGWALARAESEKLACLGRAGPPRMSRPLRPLAPGTGRPVRRRVGSSNLGSDGRCITPCLNIHRARRDYTARTARTARLGILYSNLAGRRASAGLGGARKHSVHPHKQF